MPIEFLELAWRQTWQVTLLAAAIAALVTLCGRRRPHLAHALWLAMLVKCVTPPIWSSTLGLFCWLQPVESPLPAESSVPAIHISDTGPKAEKIVHGQLLSSVADDFDLTAEEGERETRTSDQRSAASVPASVSDVGNRLAALALVIWGLGSLIRLTAILLRFAKCWRSISAAVRPASPDLLGELERLRQCLGIRRRVRLLVSATGIGPAVMGLFRPVIVLPEVIVAGRPTNELEPILAHELIHIRRGDLWVGCLQTLTCGLWWFHPLVRAVCRALAREAERCVDEELIAALRLDPARYARTLLTVLQLKQTLTPVPVFPGMKPVDITSQRLERIMSLRHGCRRRNPWLCWSALVLVLAIALPGRALTVVGEVGQSADRSRSPRVERIERYYDVPELIEKLARRYKVSSVQASQMLVDRLDEPQVAIEIEDRTTLKILAPAAAHTEIATKLAVWRAAPYDQLITEAFVIEVPPGLLDTLLGPQATPAGPRQAIARTKIFDEKAAQTFWRQVRQDRAVRIVSEPRIRSLDRQPVVFDLGQERQFVTDYEETAERTVKPQVTKLRDGVRLEMRPALQADGAIEVSAALQISEIRPVDDATVRVAEKQASVQHPEVWTVMTRSTSRVVPNQMLILGVPLPDAEDEPQSAIVVALRLHPVFDKEATGASPPAANDDHVETVVRAYAVPDFAAPAPRLLSIALSHSKAGPADGTPAFQATIVPGSEATIDRGRPATDLAPLQTLIQTAVAPESWTGKGGTGQIQIHAATSSLVIRQTPEVHEQIVTLLSNLRHEMDLQVALELKLVRFADRDWFKQLNWPEKTERLREGIALSPARVAEFGMLDEVQQGDATTRFPKPTLFNEQVAEFSLPLGDDKSARTLAVA
ncbi:MAG TPA: M56 family metallopeptidase, partial [Pirellulales bacterium]|nr:M56 family metallopeptidase [Pirellulales bacterium]